MCFVNVRFCGSSSSFVGSVVKSATFLNFFIFVFKIFFIFVVLKFENAKQLVAETEEYHKIFELQKSIMMKTAGMSKLFRRKMTA